VNLRTTVTLPTGLRDIGALPDALHPLAVRAPLMVGRGVVMPWLDSAAEGNQATERTDRVRRPMSSALPDSLSFRLVRAVAEAGMTLPEGLPPGRRLEARPASSGSSGGSMWLETMQPGYRAWRCC
jgi:hypothetical protein